MNTTAATQVYTRSRPRTGGRRAGTTTFNGQGIVAAARGAKYNGLHLTSAGHVSASANGNTLQIATFMADALASHLDANGWTCDTEGAGK